VLLLDRGDPEARVERIVLFGRSVGSLYALEGVRRRPRAAAVVIESGIFDVAERVRRRVGAADVGATEEAFSAELARCFDHAAVLDRFGGRTLVLHARQDALISVAHAERLYAAAREPKTLHVFERGGHNAIFWQNQAAYVGAVESLLRDVA
jgi:pimeloyl-ACP methyl ester carboxylesterase